MFLLEIAWGEFFINNLASFILGFISLYLALWVQAQAEERKERDQYLDDLKNFQKELKKNTEKKLGDMFQKIGGYEENLDRTYELFDDLADVAGDSELKDHSQNWLKKIGSVFQEFKTNYEKEYNESIEEILKRIQTRKALNMCFSYQKDIYRIYLANGVKVAQKFAKNDEIPSQISQVYSQMESIESRVKEVESMFNKEYLTSYASLMFDADEFLQTLIPALQNPASLEQDEDLADEICDMGQDLKKKMEDVGEIFAIAGNIEVIIEDIQSMEKELADMLPNLQSLLTKELEAFGVKA